MRLLVTGSSGLVGSACVEFFNEKGWEVIGIDADLRSQFFGTEQKNPEINIDICDELKVNALFATYRFDAIIHAAAQPSHDWASTNPLIDFDINAGGTLNLLEATRKYCPDAVFVHVSTDKVYGENMTRKKLVEQETRYHSSKPFDESLGLDFAGRRSLFGCSKAAADMYVQEYGNYFGMKTVCFRPGCITGKAHEGAEQHGFLAYLTRCVKEGTTYKIYGFKGKQVRDQIHASDLANAFFHFIQNPKVAAVYNIGGGPERSLSVLEALDVVGKKFEVIPTFKFHEARKGDRQWDVHDVSKFRTDYPLWDYEYSLQDIINDVCEKV